MPSTIDIGIITQIDYKKNYAEFESYPEELKLYNCISIEDEELSDLIDETFEQKLPVSYCTVDNEADSGIDACGVTLMAPASIKKLIDILQSNIYYSKTTWYSALYEKCKNAFDKNLYMIFFGV